MINFQDEIKRFKPSLDVDSIEDAIVGIDLTDMNDIMVQLLEGSFKELKNRTASGINIADEV